MLSIILLGLKSYIGVYDVQNSVLRNAGEVLRIPHPTANGIMFNISITGIGFNTGPVGKINLGGDFSDIDVTEENLGEACYKNLHTHYERFCAEGRLRDKGSKIELPDIVIPGVNDGKIPNHKP